MDLEFSAEHLCACMGPQDDEPLCPCAMNRVKIVDGRYITDKGEDLGPAGKRSRPYFDDLKIEESCQDINHNPNLNMIIDMPMNKVYVHICRTCKAEYRLMPDFALEFFKEFFKEELLDIETNNK